MRTDRTVDASTEQTMRALYDRQQATPSDEFVGALTQTLFTASTLRNHSPLAKRTSETSVRSLLTPERARHARRPLWAAGVVGLSVMLVLMSFLISRQGHEPLRQAAVPLAAVTVGSTPKPEDYGIRWTLPAPEGTFAGAASMALGRDTLYRVTASSVQAIQTSSGTPIWETGGLAPRTITADKDGAYVSITAADGTPLLVGLDAKSGEQKWSVKLPNTSENVFATSGLVLAQDWANHLTAVDPGTGAVLWQTSIGPDMPESEKVVPKMVATGDIIFASSTKGVLTAINLHGGVVLWDREGVRASQMALSGDGILGVIASATTPPDYRPTLIAYNAIDGTPLWERSLDNPINTPPGTRLVADGVRFAVTTSSLGALDSLSEAPLATPESGLAPWMTEESSSIFPEPPTFSVVFTLNPETGLLRSVSRWTDAVEPRSNPEMTSINASAVSLAISPLLPYGIFVICANGRAGWIGPEGATGESIEEVHTLRFSGGLATFAHELPGVSFNIALVDKDTAYVAMRDGSLIAIAAGNIGPEG